ncbi:MAG: hypothetical protein GC190_01045 [Alphaproteobacteria bacterium]|nr:hypothetical protein [Alphaproteobacteria bacterium]
MTGRRLWRWTGIAAELYVAFTLIFFVFNVSTIVFIRGWEPLTPGVLSYIFARDATIGIGLAALGCVFMAFFTTYFLRSLRRKQI